MKGIFFTIAALFALSATVYGKGEPSKAPGAPTGYPDMKRITPIKVSFDDDEAQKKSQDEPQLVYFNSPKDGTRIIYDANAQKYAVYYFEKMGDEEAQNRNLNYGNNTRLAPIHGSIR
ncbi:MAG: hypothetical protein JNL72_02850 [Flavipsychrobacter sp.]|nr:hypothetical protein [Flavipsychrobacter sp.]